MNSIPELHHRVAHLETEVERLRARVQRLEKPTAEAPAQPEVPKGTTKVVEPPPLPTPKPVPVPPRSELSPPVAAPSVPERTSPPPVQTPEPTESVPSRFQELLAAMNLLPPKPGESGEAQIGGWWATRIGALLAVIGVVFFGIYISANTAPWVRWLELAAIAGGVLGGGHWLDRRGLRVGPVIIGAGHALVFFTAFAASGVEAVRIVTSPIIAAALQAAAVAYIAWAGWRRESPTTATMGVALGFVSAFFTVASDLHMMAAVGGVLLALAAVGFRVRRDWWWPVFISTALNPILLFGVMLEAGSRGMVWWSAYGLLTAGFVVHLLAAAYELRQRPAQLSAKGRRLQALNTSLSLVVGFAATLVWHDYATPAGFFTVAGVALLGLALAASRQAPGDRVVGMWGVKAASLFALATIAHWDAHTRWLALLVEAVVLLAAAQRSGRNSMRAASLGAWALSLLFFLREMEGWSGELASATGAAALGYVLIGLALFEGLARQWRKAGISGINTLQVLFGIMGALPLLVFTARGFDAAWSPTLGLVLTVIFAALAWALRSRVWLPGLAVVYVGANLAIHVFEVSQHGMVWLWGAATPLGLIGVAGGALLTRHEKSGLGFATGSVGLATWIAASLHTFGSTPTLALSGGLAAAVAAVGLREKGPILTLIGMVGLLTGAMMTAVSGFDSGVGHASEIWFRLAALGVPVLWWIGSRRPRVDKPQIEVGNALIAIVGVPLVLAALQWNWPELVVALAIIAIGVGFTALGLRLKSIWPCLAATALGFSGLAHHWVVLLWEPGPVALTALASVATLALAVASQPLFLRKSNDVFSHTGVRMVTILNVLVAVASITLFSLDPNAIWSAYGTVIWALGGIVLFGIGIAGRERLHRLVGLVVLLGCIPRVFVHDITEAEHRIAAFIVLGLLLLWVGFSYQKFRHLIEGDKHSQEDDEE